jgi:hypothetical protein
MIIKLDKKKFIEYNEKTNEARVYEADVLGASKYAAEQRLKELPQEPTDQELLEWARVNYPRMDYSVERASLEKVIEDNTRRLTEWQSL